MDRAVAIDVAKTLFIESACKVPSVSAALATVLFDHAANAPGAPGFTRSELVTAVSTLTEEWGIGETYEDALHRELSRLPQKLQAFAKKRLPYHGVTSISGPTGIARGDQGGLLFLKVEYVPQATETAGALASAFAKAVTEVIGEDALSGYDRDVAAGTVRVVATTPVRNPTARGVMITVLLGLTAALSLLAHPTSRRWIVTYFQALIRKDGASRSAGSTINVQPDPHYTLQNVRVKNREAMAIDFNTSFDGRCDNGKAHMLLMLSDLPAINHLVLLRNDEVYKEYGAFPGGRLDLDDYHVEADRHYVYKLAQRDAAQNDYLTSRPLYVHVPRCTAKNHLPVPLVFKVEPTRGAAPLTVHCVANASDADGDPVRYRWTFREEDGFRNVSGGTATHTFSYGGAFEVQAWADDGRSEERLIGRTVVVVDGPPALASTPADVLRAMGYGTVDPPEGPPGTTFTFHVLRQKNERGAHVVQYRFRLGYCDGSSRKLDPQKPCVTDPQASPDYRHAYQDAGQYKVEAELTFDDGEMEVKPLAYVNVGVEDVLERRDGGRGRYIRPIAKP